MTDLEISGLRVGDWKVEIDPDGDLDFTHCDSHMFDLQGFCGPDLTDLAALIAAVAKLEEQR